MAIRCCNGCVPPQRNPYCHSTCPKYLKEKAKHDAEMAVELQRKITDSNLKAQQLSAVTKAYKKRKGMKG